MISIVFVGDIMLSRNVASFLDKNRGHKIISDEVVDIFNKADLCIGNLECPVSNENKIVKKNGFCAEYQTLVQIEKIDFVSLSNNHAFDCGTDGVFDTINRLRDAKIRWSGIIADYENIVKPEVYKIKNKKIAIYSCVVDECLGSDNRRENIKLVNINDKRIRDSVKKYRCISDIVIVLIHGGNEMIAYPQPSFKTICREMIDDGADLVVTTHPHVLGGYEKYMDKYIFYSIGDFIFDSDSYMRKKSGVLSVTINEEMQWEMIPIVMNNKMRIDIALDDIGEKIIRKFNNVSSKIIEKDYEKKYKYYYASEFFLFQIDRTYYKIKTKGILNFIVFMFSRMRYVAHYMKAIINREYI